MVKKIKNRYKSTFFLCFVTLLYSCGNSVYREKTLRYVDEKINGEDHDKEETPETGFSLSPGMSGMHAIYGWETTPIEVKVEDSFTSQQVQIIEHVITRFNQIVGWELMTYLGKRIAARADSTELYGMQDNDGLKLYNRSNWDVTGKPAVVLATTIWENSKDNDQVIKTAEIHFNTKQYAFVDNLQPDLPEDEAQEFVDLETLLLHEVGHALGLSHQLASVDVNSVMNPTVFIGRGLTNRTFSEMDIANIQLIYRR